MYFLNGFVYGGHPEEVIKVIDVKPLQDMIMLITFNNGEQRVFDATSLDGQVFKPLQEKEIFSNPIIDHGVITWKNGEIDCAPEYMYEHSYEYVCEAM